MFDFCGINFRRKLSQKRHKENVGKLVTNRNRDAASATDVTMSVYSRVIRREVNNVTCVNVTHS